MKRKSGQNRSQCLSMLPMAMLLGLVAVSGPVFAQQRLTGEDLDIVVDSRWAGTTHGGYLPVRIRARNNAKDRSVTFQVRRTVVSPVTQTIQLQSGATTELTLLVPMIGEMSYGRPELQVWVDGKRIPGLETNFEVRSRLVPWPEPAMLVISDRKASFEDYDKAVHGFFQAQPQASLRRGSYRSVSSESDRQWITPEMLPRTWLAYSGLDIVSVPISTLVAMEADARQAILGWVETGGTLLETDVGEKASESRKLATVLELAQRAAVGDTWRVPTDESRKAALIRNPAMMAHPEGAAAVAVSQAAVLESTNPAPPPAVFELSWPPGDEAFAFRRIQRGRVVAFPGDPLTGTEADWTWFFGALSETQVGSRWFNWQGRHGMSSRQGQSDFLDFTVPGVGGVPIAVFLILITLFSIVIGPVNFVYLKRRGQLYLLVVTVPVIALVTSVSMIGYAIVSNGLGIKSHTRSITFLDQDQETAVTIARVAMFAGLAPSSLDFSRESAVYPVYPHRTEFGGASVDWTDRQVFSNNWIKARTPAQFQVVRRFPLRGRISIGSPDDQEQLPVDNGLEWNLRCLFVHDAAGDRYLAQDVMAGRAVTIKKLPPGDLHNQMIPTTKMISDHFVAANGLAGSREDLRKNRSVETQFSLIEVNRRSFQSWSGFDQMPRRSYMAIIDQDPGIERGCSTSDTGSLHVLIGQY